MPTAEDAACASVGVQSCATGFRKAASGWGCEAIGPPEPCNAMQRAQVGEDSCIVVDSCGHTFPPADATFYVGAKSHGGLTSVRTISEALDLASSGDVTGTGSYDPLESLYGNYGGDPLDSLYGRYAGDPLDSLYGRGPAAAPPATFEPLDFGPPLDHIDAGPAPQAATYEPLDVTSGQPATDPPVSSDAVDEGSDSVPFDDATDAAARSDEQAQRFDDGSGFFSVTPEDGSSPFHYATPAPPDYVGTSTQTFDDGSSFNAFNYDDGSSLPGGSTPALEYQPPSGDIIYDATQMSPAQAHTLEGLLERPGLHPDTRREIEGALDAWRTQQDPLQNEGPLAPASPYPEIPPDNVGGFGGGAVETDVASPWGSAGAAQTDVASPWGPVTVTDTSWG